MYSAATYGYLLMIKWTLVCSVIDKAYILHYYVDDMIHKYPKAYGPSLACNLVVLIHAFIKLFFWIYVFIYTHTVIYIYIYIGLSLSLYIYIYIHMHAPVCLFEWWRILWALDEIISHLSLTFIILQVVVIIMWYIFMALKFKWTVCHILPFNHVCWFYLNVSYVPISSNALSAMTK